MIKTLKEAGTSALSVGATAGTLGIVMASLTLSGLGVKFSSLILSVGQGNLFLTLVLVAFIATIIGMGLPTTASYIILSILAAPSLIQLGIDPVPAHMVCLWFAVISNITPPVCVAAFAGASIAGAHPMKTGLNAVPLGLFMYILPFFFIYEPAIFVYGQELAVSVKIIASLLISIACFAAGFQGWFFRNLRTWERAVFLLASPLLVDTRFFTDIFRYIVVVAMAVYTYKTKKQAANPQIAA
ncbi:MAG TPA: TRAP transporter large permease subunit [Firmicutes bacterium]|nr:TRAP transporter large permease subunit [Bacillota bacterium]